MIKNYHRWKYAEEAAKNLIDQGHLVRLTMEPDVEYIDEDETYVSDVFLVEDLGER